MKIFMKKSLEVDIPTVPNFIKVDGNMESLTFFTHEQLKDISKKMYEKMIQRRKEQEASEEVQSSNVRAWMKRYIDEF